MKQFLTRLAIFLSLAVGGAMISHWFFLVLGGLLAIIFFQAVFESVLAAFLVEILSGAPAGVISIPMSLTTIVVEVFRVHMSEYFSMSAIILLLAGLLIFSIANIVMIGIL